MISMTETIYLCGNTKFLIVDSDLNIPKAIADEYEAVTWFKASNLKVNEIKT